MKQLVREHARLLTGPRISSPDLALSAHYDRFPLQHKSHGKLGVRKKVLFATPKLQIILVLLQTGDTSGTMTSVVQLTLSKEGKTLF